MARPLKEGYDYFPLNVDFLDDKKVKLLNAEFGDGCIKTILALFSRVYKEKGYYATVDDDDCLLMSQGVLGGQSPQYISEIIQGCVRRSLFDERVFHLFGVLTSVGIQRRYLQMAQNRAAIPIYEEYLLLDLQNEESIRGDVLNRVVLKSVLSEKTPCFPRENPGFPSENSPKVKERKVKESKEKNTPPPDGGDAPADTAAFDRFWTAYPKKVDRKATCQVWQRLHLSDGEVDEVLSGLARWKMSQQWSDPRFIPYPSKFLRHELWRDTPGVSGTTSVPTATEAAVRDLLT